MTSKVVGMAEFISLRAYARHRQCTLSAVQKAIDSRRVHGDAIRVDGQRITGIDPELADRQWAENTDALESARNGKDPGALQLSAPAAASPDKPAAEPTGDQGSFLAARVKEAELRGELLELDKLERIGELLPRAVVQEEFAEIFAQLKNAAFRIPDQKAQALAGETDPVRIHRVLSDALRKVFDEFSSRLNQPVALVADDAALAGEREALLP
jgi:hypothetical protein